MYGKSMIFDATTNQRRYSHRQAFRNHRYQHMKTTHTLPAAALAALAPSIALASCGASSCAVTSNWTSESARKALAVGLSGQL